MSDFARDGDPLTVVETPSFRFVQVNDPSLARLVLTRHSHDLVKGPFFTGSRDLLGDGILTSDEPLHGLRRREIAPFFSGAGMDSYGAVLKNVVDESLCSWLALGEVDVVEAVRELTLTVVLSCFFGSPTTKGSKGFLDDLSDALDSLTAGKLLAQAVLGGPELRRTRSWSPLDRAAAWALVATLRVYALGGPASEMSSDRIRRYPDALIADRIQELEGQSCEHLGGETDDLLSVLCGLIHEEADATWTRSSVRDELLTILLAGHETTASALAWSLAHISSSDNDECMSDEAVDCVIHETLRLYPPAWVIPRLVASPFEVAGMRFLPGTHLVMSPYLYHRQGVFDLPSEFSPNRWSRELMARPPIAFMPFGAGDRACIGQRFAWMEMQTVLRLVTQRLRIRSQDSMPEPEFLFTLRPASAFRVQVELR